MDHTFRTRRDELERYADALSMLGDMTVLLSMTIDDHAKMMSRCDEDLSNDTVRISLCRRASCVGLLMSRVYEILPKTATTPTMIQQWKTFVQKAIPVNETFVPELEKLRKELNKKRKELEKTEFLSESSSYDDYSDSSTEDTSDQEEDSEESEEEEEEEEEKPPVPPKKKRSALSMGSPMKLLSRLGGGEKDTTEKEPKKEPPPLPRRGKKA